MYLMQQGFQQGALEFFFTVTLLSVAALHRSLGRSFPGAWGLRRKETDLNELLFEFFGFVSTHSGP